MDLLIVRSICTTVSGPNAGRQSHRNPLRDLGQCNCKREQAPGPAVCPITRWTGPPSTPDVRQNWGGETIPHFLTVFVFNQANNSLVSFPLAPAASDSGGKGSVCFCVRTAEHRCNYTGVILWHASVLHGKCFFLCIFVCTMLVRNSDHKISVTVCCQKQQWRDKLCIFIQEVYLSHIVQGSNAM